MLIIRCPLPNASRLTALRTCYVEESVFIAGDSLDCYAQVCGRSAGRVALANQFENLQLPWREVLRIEPSDGWTAADLDVERAYISIYLLAVYAYDLNWPTPKKRTASVQLLTAFGHCYC
jgi:hypothetical protein